jgi:twitching motility protein PilT
MIVGSAGVSPSFPPRSAGTPPPTAPTTAPNKAPHKAQSAKPGAKDSPSLEAILRIANDAGHSDVHLGVGERPRFRARGEIQATD